MPINPAPVLHIVVTPQPGFTTGSQPQQPLPYILNVQEPPFNAKGDGVTDDRGAIQKALDAAQGGHAVFLPSGRYFVSSNGYGGLSLPSNAHFYGNGASSVIVYTNAGAAIYAQSRTNVVVRDLCVDEMNLGVRGIELRACQDSSVIGSWVMHSKGYSVYLHHLNYNQRCQRCTVQGCHVIDNHDVGIELRGATGCSVIGNTVSTAGGTTENPGFHVSYIAWDGASDCVIANNISEGVRTNSTFVSYEIDGVEGSEAPWDTHDILVENNVSRYASTAVVVYGEPKVPNHPRHIRVQGNLFSHPRDCGMMIANCSEIVFSDNSITGSCGVLDVRCPPLYPWFGTVTNLVCHGNTMNGILTNLLPP